VDQFQALRTFRRVAQLRSFAAAARELDVAPAVVTRRIGELESYLGLRLLNRTTRRVNPTPAGEEYLEQVDALLKRLDEVDAELKGSGTRPKGELRVAGPLDFLQLQIVPLLGRFRDAYPEVSFDLIPLGNRSVPDPSADVNLLITGSAFAPAADMVIRRLAKTSGILCASAHYLHRRGMPSAPEDLRDHDVLIPSLPEVTRHYSFTPRAPVSTHSVPIEFEARSLKSCSPELLTSAALCGLGIVGMMSFAAHEHLMSGALVHVLPDWHVTSREVYLVLHGREHMPMRTRAFIDFLSAQFADSLADPWLRGERQSASKAASALRTISKRGTKDSKVMPASQC
jgi:DNA-binding transcriptional LysR family regulator